MSFSFLRPLCALSLTACLAPALSAQVLTYTFEGVVDDISIGNPDSWSGTAFGEPVQVVIQVDAAAAATTLSPGLAIYGDSVQGFSVQVGSVSSAAWESGEVRVRNDNPAGADCTDRVVWFVNGSMPVGQPKFVSVVVSLSERSITCPDFIDSDEIPRELGAVHDPYQNIVNFSMFTSGYGFVDATVSLTSIESSFVESCFGNGGASPGCTDCPCGNSAASAQGGCSNSSGLSARLIASGRPRVSDDSLSMEMRGGAPNTFAILSSGASLAPANAANPCFGLNSGITSPFFDGLRCTVQDILRHGTRATDAAGDVGVTTAGFGPPWGPAGGLIAANGFVAGQTRHFQIVYRDDPMLGCGTGQNTTQAVSIEMLP